MANGIGRVGWRNFVSTTPTTSSIITNGLVLNLDTGNALSYSGTGTTWTDLSGNGNNATLVNGTSYNSSNGGTMVFDGINDYANVNGVITSNSYTISTWCKIDYTNSTYYGRIIEKGLNNEFTLCINKNFDRRYTFQFGDGSGGWLSSNSLISLTPKYDNVTITVENTSLNNYTVKMYINGVYETTNNKNTTLSNNNVLYIGGNIQVPGLTSLYGNVANTLMYSRALSASEVLQNFNSTKEKFGYPSYTTRTAAFANATGITDTTILNALNTFDSGLISNGLDTKMKALYPFVGGTANTHKFNFMDSRDLDIAFRLSIFGGWTHTSKGIVGSATNNYANTNLNALTHISASDNSFSVYKQNNETIYECYIRVGPVISTFITTSELFYWNGNNYFMSSGTAEKSASISGRGFYMVNRNINTLSLFKNTTKTSFTDSFTTQYNGNYIIGNGSDVGNYTTNNTLSFIHIGQNLSDSEQTIFYNLIQAMQTALSRQV
jgi:hypothetical protein